MTSPDPLFDQPTRFEDAIRAFEDADVQAPPPQNGIVFVGSSSIRRWENLAASFPDLPVIQRGFGGSFLSESVFYADRIVIPYRPRTVLVYAGENDIGHGRSGRETFEQLQLFVAKVHEKLPQTQIFYVSLKPSPGRGALIKEIRVVNQLAQKWAAQTSNFAVIDVHSPMLDENGIARGEFFVEDGVHMTGAGYALWTSILAPFLAER